MPLQFDANGHLFPYNTIDITVEEVEEYFVFNEHRLGLYLSLKQFIRAVKKLGDAYFVKMYVAEHPKHNFSKFDELDWYHFLTKDRKRRPKGIVKIQLLEA
jgi:hypothetical protein